MQSRRVEGPAWREAWRPLEAKRSWVKTHLSWVEGPAWREAWRPSEAFPSSVKARRCSGSSSWVQALSGAAGSRCALVELRDDP